MTLHAEFLEQLQQAAAKVRLVASLCDPRLEFGAEDDLRIFIPDLHLVSRATRARYRYGTNDQNLLADVLERVARMKARGGRTIATYQVGDFLDLWREEPIASLRTDAATRIVADHPELMHALFSPALKARFLLGNHDVDLSAWPNFTAWERRYFLPARGNPRATGMALHGDVFDWVEMLPDAFNRFFVYFFSPFAGPADHDLKDVKRVIQRQNAALDFTQRICGTAEFGVLRETADPGTTHNLGDHPFLNRAHEVALEARRRYALDLRFMVIGHTHQARIAVYERGDDFFALIDCGAWVENGRDQSGTSFPNRQIVALSANEARIYQLDL